MGRDDSAGRTITICVIGGGLWQAGAVVSRSLVKKSRAHTPRLRDVPRCGIAAPRGEA
jgi:hypothetical protein